MFTAVTAVIAATSVAAIAVVEAGQAVAAAAVAASLVNPSSAWGVSGEFRSLACVSTAAGDEGAVAAVDVALASSRLRKSIRSHASLSRRVTSWRMRSIYREGGGGGKPIPGVGWEEGEEGGRTRSKGTGGAAVRGVPVVIASWWDDGVGWDWMGWGVGRYLKGSCDQL